MRRKPRFKVNEGPFVSEYFEQQDIQVVGRTHALDVAPLRNELEDLEATHQVQNLTQCRIYNLTRFMDFLTATAYDLSFAKSLVDYDDKNLTKAMT